MFFLPIALALNRFLVQERLYANALSFSAEVLTQCISMSKATTTAPLAVLLELSFTNEELLS
jgi:hypothetical protein